MYEFPTVERLVQTLDKQLEAAGVNRVQEVRVRKGDIFSELELREAYRKFADRTRLKGSQLIVDEGNFVHYCPECGHTHAIKDEDLVGHLFICPECGEALRFDEFEELELVGYTCD